MSKFPVPAEDRLEQLIRESFDFMPGPDMARLAQIGDKLSRYPAPEKRVSAVNRLAWWIVLLLAGGFATAAWWSGGPWFKKTGPAATVKTDAAAQQARPTGPEQVIPAPDLQDKSNQRQDTGESPLIYQRED